jgi:type I restriction enzyme S subunit
LDAAFAAIPIEDISESIQNNIVVILQGLEKKIAINRQLNQNLPTLDHSSEVVEARHVA